MAAFDGQVGRPSCSGSKGGIVGVTLFPKRLGAPEEVASRIVEAVTNSHLDAGTIRVDGGIRMQPE